MSPSPPIDSESSPLSPEELRVVVDANITLAMFLARRDQPMVASPKRVLLSLLPSASC